MPCSCKSYAVREEGGTPEVDAVIRIVSNVRKDVVAVSKASVGAHPPSEKILHATPPRRSADAAQLYTRLCVCSGSLLARS